MFSGTGVVGLRHHLNTREEFAEYREGRAPRRRTGAVTVTNVGQAPAPDMEGFVGDDGDGLEDDDMGDGSDLIDFNADLTNLAHNPLPPQQQFHDTGLLHPNQINIASQAVPSTGNAAPSTEAQAPALAGPSTAGSGVLSSPGPSTASMQTPVDHETQAP